VAPASCGELIPEGLSLKTCKVGERVAIEIPNEVSSFDRLYPPATPVQELGSLVHTGAIVTDGSCGEAKIEFLPPHGGAVTIGDATKEPFLRLNFEHDSSVRATYAFLGGPLYKATNKNLNFGRNIPELDREKLRSTTSGIVDIYSKYSSSFGEPHVFFAYHLAPKEAFAGSFHGDVTSDRSIVRLSFFREGNTSTLDEFQVASFIAHEFGHVTQPKNIRDVGADEPALIEGNAEMLSLLVLSELNQSWQIAIGKKIESAINRCLTAAGPITWKENRSRTGGAVPYDCGVAFAAASLLQESADGAQQSYLQRMFSRNKKGIGKPYGLLHKDVVSMMLGGQTVQTWLPPMLAKITRPVNETTIATEAELGRTMGRAVLEDLLRVDCDHSSGFWTRQSYFELDGVSGCKTLKDGMQIESLNAVTILGQPTVAIQQARAVCTKTNQISVGLVGGESVVIHDCGKGFPERRRLSIEASPLISARP
jgi:hypothetical protein